MTIQDVLDEVEEKLNQADAMSDFGALIIAIDQLRLVVEAVIRYQRIDTSAEVASQ